MKITMHLSEYRLGVLKSIDGLVTNIAEQKEILNPGMQPYIVTIEIKTEADLLNLFRSGMTIGWDERSKKQNEIDAEKQRIENFWKGE